MNRIKLFLKYLKRKFDVNGVLAACALLISLITMYFQFLNVSHEVSYAFLSPSMGGEKMQIPIVFKNTGNQNELILDANIELEVIPGDTVKNYFRRIGDENKKLFPLILAPGEYKVITLLGDYMDYFKGMLEYSPNGLKYREITNLDTLSVVLTTKFVAASGVSETKRQMGRISFNKDRTFNRFDYEPIRLVELEADNDITMVSGALVNGDISFSVGPKDSLTSDQIEHIKFMINVVPDSAAKAALVRLLNAHNVRYPD